MSIVNTHAVVSMFSTLIFPPNELLYNNTLLIWHFFLFIASLNLKCMYLQQKSSSASQTEKTKTMLDDSSRKRNNTMKYITLLRYFLKPQIELKTKNRTKQNKIKQKTNNCTWNDSGRWYMAATAGGRVGCMGMWRGGDVKFGQDGNTCASIGHLNISHNITCLPRKILHKHCLLFLLGPL